MGFPLSLRFFCPLPTLRLPNPVLSIHLPRSLRRRHWSLMKHIACQPQFGFHVQSYLIPRLFSKKPTHECGIADLLLLLCAFVVPAARPDRGGGGPAKEREREDADTAAVAAIMVRAASVRLSSVVRPLAAVASYVALCADDLVAADAVQVPNAAARRRGGEGVGGKCCDQRGYHYMMMYSQHAFLLID